MVKIVSVVGARPNFIKIAPLMAAMQRYSDLHPILVHTGQHYDVVMSECFFRDLQIDAPDIALEVGPGSHASQTAEVMKRLEPVLERERPDLVLVVGDVNSTMAGALTAVKLGIPVAHVEAGLRSFDRSMPEEINRLVTDCVSDYLFVSEESGIRNLLAENIPVEKMFFVGNVMIDSLERFRRMWTGSTIHERLGTRKGRYAIVTLHRPSNVDDPDTLNRIISAVAEIARRQLVIFPVHPRTRKRVEDMPVLGSPVRSHDACPPDKGIRWLDPLGYLDFMSLVANAGVVLTDSGGLQEETTALGVPCLTLRDTTERPVTVTHGTNRIVGSSPERIAEALSSILAEPRPSIPRPPLWDGEASQRIVAVLRERVRPASPRLRAQAVSQPAT